MRERKCRVILNQLVLMALFEFQLAELHMLVKVNNSYLNSRLLQF